MPCCRVCSCCLGGIATIGLRHAGDTPSRGFYGSKTPRCAAGLCGGLSVLCSTCSPPRPDAPKRGCLGRSGRRFERRFAMLGACRRASSVWSAWLASSVLAVAGPGVNRCRVQKGGTPQGPASLLPRPSCRRAWLVIHVCRVDNLAGRALLPRKRVEHWRAHATAREGTHTHSPVGPPGHRCGGREGVLPLICPHNNGVRGGRGA